MQPLNKSFNLVICEPECQNGGKCRKNGKCKCVPGFYGKMCEVQRTRLSYNIRKRKHIRKNRRNKANLVKQYLSRH